MLTTPVLAVVDTLSVGDHFDACTVMRAIEAPQIADAFLLFGSPE